jgi:archaellum component FlaG (FlaF/FlaG flagellin family)
MKKNLASILLTVFMTALFGQNPTHLAGNWHIQSYYSTLNDSVKASLAEKKCCDLMVLKISKKGKMKFIFSDRNDSVVFAGKITFKKNNTVQIKNNILQGLYLGELEKCITAELREDMRRVFLRTFACAVEKEQLVFYYNTPSDLRHKKAMVMVRRPG